MSKFTRMSAEEFESNLPKLAGDFTVNTINLARLVLVEGQTHTEAAKAANVSRQNVGKTVERVMARFNEFPSDWVLLKEVWAPPDLAKEFRDKINEVLNKHKKTPL